MLNGPLKIVFNGQRLFTVNDSIYRMVEGFRRRIRSDTKKYPIGYRQLQWGALQIVFFSKFQ